jgi:uridine kinase
MIRVTVEGSTVEVEPGATPWDVLQRDEVKKDPDDVVGVMVNNKIADLRKPLQADCRLRFFTLRSRDGLMVYQRSLTYLLVMAVREVYPDLQVYVNHTLGDGLFCELRAPRMGHGGAVPIAQRDLDKVEAAMRRLVEADLPFERTRVTLDEARAIFEANGQQDKVALLKYRENAQISMYRCGEQMNHFCGYLLPRTGLLHLFELRRCEPGFLLRYPRHTDPTELRPFVWYPKLFNVYREFEAWGKILNLETVADLNAVIESNGISEFIKVAEALHEKRLGAIADQITAARDRVRIVLVSGPSSSGKTTFSKRLGVHLRVNGLRPVIISLDDFFVDRERTPRDEAGEYDFEAFETIDVALFASTVRKLMMGEAVPMPTFDFKSGTSRRSEALTLAPDQVLIVEGIHGLNPRLLPTIPEGMKFRVFVSALTQLNIDYHNRIASSDTRMVRRMVRDSQYRGYSAEETINRWPSVRRGEGKNIFPHQEEADAIFNSALTYELGVLRQLAVPTLEEITSDVVPHAEARRLLYLLSHFKEIPIDEVPRHSILREFIGGSSFSY